MEYVLLAVAGVGFVLLFTLPSPRAVLLMMLAVGLVDYCLFGEMFMINIRFNQVSVINMIMATGLAVDYSVYFAQVGTAVGVTLKRHSTRNGKAVVGVGGVHGVPRRERKWAGAAGEPGLGARTSCRRRSSMNASPSWLLAVLALE